MAGYASAALAWSRQCAAVSTRFGAMRLQPQKWAPLEAERMLQNHCAREGARGAAG